MTEPDPATVKLAAQAMYLALCSRGFPLAASAVQRTAIAWTENPTADTCRAMRLSMDAGRACLRVAGVLQ